MSREVNPKTDRLLYTVTNPYNFSASAGNRLFAPRQTIDIFVTAAEAVLLQATGWITVPVEELNVNTQLGLITPPLPVSGVGCGALRLGTTPNSLNQTMTVNARTPLQFTADPLQTMNYLNPPFVGWNFWQNNKLQLRRKGDYIFILVNLLVQASVAGGKMLADLDVNSVLGAPTGTDTEDIFGAAGQTQRLTFKLYLLVGSQSIANGASINLTSSVPVTLLNAAIIVAPFSSYYGAVS